MKQARERELHKDGIQYKLKGESGEKGSKLQAGLNRWNGMTANKYWRMVNGTGEGSPFHHGMTVNKY